MIGRHRPWPSLARLVLSSLALSACGGGPPPDLYVLGDTATVAPEPKAALPDPVVELKPVRVPDYLDTTDMITRTSSGRIVTSQSARWAERLSVGVTRAVATSLEAKLPQLTVTTSPPLDDPQWQILIDIQAFEAQSGGQCILTGRWSIRRGRGGEKLKEEKIALTTALGAAREKDLVAAMDRQVDQLAGRIAVVLQTEEDR